MRCHGIAKKETLLAFSMNVIKNLWKLWGNVWFAKYYLSNRKCIDWKQINKQSCGCGKDIDKCVSRDPDEIFEISSRMTKFTKRTIWNFWLATFPDFVNWMSDPLILSVIIKIQCSMDFANRENLFFILQFKWR